MLKIFRRVDVLRKYFNTKILYQRQLEQGKKHTEVTAMEEIFERKCCIRGYHVYKEVWEAAVEESLVCKREPENASNRYTVAVKKELSQEICLKRYRGCVRWFCDGEVATIECTVTGHRKYSADLAQGGLEVPTLYFSGQRLWNPQVQKPIDWPKVVSDRHY